MKDESRDVQETKTCRAEATAVSESSDKVPIPDYVTIALAAVVSAVVTWLLR